MSGISAAGFGFCVEGEKAGRERFVERWEDGVQRGYFDMAEDGEIGFGGFGHGCDDVVAARLGINVEKLNVAAGNDTLR